MMAAMTQFHFSLRWRLLLLVGLAIAPLVALTLLAGMRERGHALDSARENLQRLTNLAATNEAQSLERTKQILRDLSSVPAVRGAAEGCNSLMADILSKNEVYVNFGLIQLSGDVSCSAVPMANAVNLKDRSHFQRAIAERRFIAGNYVFGRVVRKHTVNATYPIIDDGGVRAVLFAAIDLGELDKFVTDVELPPGSLLWTLDGDGSVISRRPQADAWLGKRMPGTALRIAATAKAPAFLHDPDGVERLYASARVGKNGLTDYTVLIGVPRDAILATATRSQRMAIAALLVTVLLAALAAWYGGSVLVLRRVKQLASTADLIASGSLSTRSGIRHGDEEISQLARSIDNMAAALEERQGERDAAQAKLLAADQRKDEFLAMLAHELRNPLAPISAGAQMLQRSQPDVPVVARTTGIIVRQVAHMTRLIDDLLDVSRVTRGLVKLHREAVDMSAIIADAVEQIDPLIAKKAHTCSVELPPHACHVIGDRKRLVQICSNLINNAAKYTPQGGHLRIALTCDGKTVTLSVADDGIGMPAELQARVFDLFAQGERDADRSQGGLGLGLALVKMLVLLHRGTVTAYSAGVGLGSVFTVTLPRGEEAVIAAAPETGERAAPAKRRCLVVDDNVDAAATLAMMLVAAGHEALTTHSAGEAIALAGTVRPDVLLLDIGLPDMNGNQLVAYLRRIAGIEHSLYVAVTGYGRKEDRDSSLRAGFDDYFVKPIEIDALLEKIAQAPVTALKD